MLSSFHMLTPTIVLILNSMFFATDGLTSGKRHNTHSNTCFVVIYDVIYVLNLLYIHVSQILGNIQHVQLVSTFGTSSIKTLSQLVFVISTI